MRCGHVYYERTALLLSCAAPASLCASVFLYLLHAIYICFLVFENTYNIPSWPESIYKSLCDFYARYVSNFTIEGGHRTIAIKITKIISVLTSKSVGNNTLFIISPNCSYAIWCFKGSSSLEQDGFWLADNLSYPHRSQTIVNYNFIN